MSNLQAAHRLLNDDGLIYVETIHTDCAVCDSKKENWNMLFWNHTHHFSTQTLQQIITKAGLGVVETQSDYNSILVEIVARKVVGSDI